MKKYKLLCIDDEPVILDLYELMFEDLYPILKATSPEEAIDLLKNHHQEIIYVFSDFTMNGMNGLQFREEMIRCGFEIPFSMVTGNYDLEMAKQGMSLRIDSFLHKPIEKEELLKLVQNLGEKRRIQLVDETEMVTSFISESLPMLEEIENLILVLEKNPKDMNALNTYFRLLHTIKGTASCVGLKSLPSFTHAYEDLVSLAKEQKIAITPGFVDSLLFGLDRLKYMYSKISDEEVFEFDISEWLVTIKSYENLKTECQAGAGAADGHQESRVHSEKLAIPLETLDSFLELSGSMTILRNTIYKAISRVELKHPNDKDVEFLSSTIEELHKITSMVQKQISEMRKIGADNITRPLKRVVRDTSKELNKEVEIIIHNEHLKIDNTVAKIISNSLVHLVRNSIDHGIEMPETRQLLHKERKGVIELSFYEDGDSNIVVLKDNGAGINNRRVLEKAIEKNIITEKMASGLSHHEILALIFESGFSTSQNVSSISGRGVGMDMVKSSVESIGGKIKIDSTEGLGSCFTLHLPQPKSVLINKTLMVEEQTEFFSIPIDDVVEVVCIEREDFPESLFHVGGYPVIKRYEELIPVFKLSNCLVGKEGEDSSDDLLKLNAMVTIILKHNNTKFGLIVDKIHDIEESVVRKIKPVLNASDLYAGVTYFGDDDLALVLNVENLAKEKMKATERIEKEKVKLHTLSKTEVVNEPYELFTFIIEDHQYGIAKEKVFRFEILASSLIQCFNGNYFFKYREGIVKIIGLNPIHLSLMAEKEMVNLIIMKSDELFYAFHVDEIREFIISDFPIESHFSKGDKIRGSIIYQEEIIYLLSESELDKMAQALIDGPFIEMKDVA